MLDYSTIKFLFHVDHVKIVDQPGEVINAFTVLRKAQSLHTLVLPPPREILNKIDHEVLHNDFFCLLERKFVEWSMIDVKL
jgi:hypothetical protein